MKTQEDIINKIEQVEDMDSLGIFTKTLRDALDKPYIEDSLISDIEGFLPNAIEQFQSKPASMASRANIDALQAYLWMLNDGSLEQIYQIGLDNYGEDTWVFVAEKFGVDIKIKK